MIGCKVWQAVSCVTLIEVQLDKCDQHAQFEMLRL